MESFERVRCVMQGGTPDRPPLYDALRNDAAIEYYAQEAIDPGESEFDCV